MRTVLIITESLCVDTGTVAALPGSQGLAGCVLGVEMGGPGCTWVCDSGARTEL